MKWATTSREKAALIVSGFLVCVGLLAVLWKWLGITALLWIGLIVIAAAVVFIIWVVSRPDASTIDIRMALKKAQKRVSLAKFSNLATVFVIGNGVLENAQLGAELVTDAGGPLGIWLFERTAFVEVGQSILNDSSNAKALIRHFRPSCLRYTLNGRRQAPRACLAVIDSQDLLKDSFPQRLRQLNEFLRCVAISAASQLPVYVLLQVDGLAYSSSWLMTLGPDLVSGLTATTIAAKITEDGLAEPAFTITETLGNIHRRMLAALIRERLIRYNEPINTEAFLFVESLLEPSNSELASACEERSPADRVAAALDGISRRSHAHTANPFIRGVMLSGPSDSGQRNFYLQQAVRDTILADLPAQRVNQSLVDRCNSGIIVAIACALAVLISLISISAIRNRALAQPFREPMRSYTVVSSESLRELEQQRILLERLTTYEVNGTPWTMLLGLSMGHDLYPDAKAIYFRNFQNLLLAPLHAQLVGQMKAEFSKEAQNGAINSTYERLRAYLLTTSEAARPQRQSISSYLSDSFIHGRDLSAEQQDLVRQQFAYYAGQPISNLPFNITPDPEAIADSRNYLCQVFSSDRLQRTEKQVSQKEPGLEFRSAGVVSDGVKIDGAFSASGWKAVNTALGDLSSLQVEPWVIRSCQLGDAHVGQNLAEAYAQDYAAKWREFLGAASVIRFRSPSEARRSLEALSENTSPLLAVLCLASQNTDVPNTDIANAFQPVHQVAPPAACREGTLIADGNREYMNSLAGLQAAMANVTVNPNDPTVVQQARDYGTRALTVASQVALTFRVDTATGNARIDKSVADLLKAPIQSSLATIEGKCGGCPPPPPPSPPVLEPSLCDAFRPLSTKFPFAADSTAEVSLDEFNDFFAPKGKFQDYYDSVLMHILARKTTKPTAGSVVNSSFLEFVDKVVLVQKALYARPNVQKMAATTSKIQEEAIITSPKGHLNFKMNPWLPSGFTKMKLRIDGTAVESTGGWKDFVWPGTGGAKLTLEGAHESVDIFDAEGTWAIFRLAGSAEWQAQTGGIPTLLRSVPNRGVVPILQLDAEASEFLFRPGFLSSFTCVSEPQSSPLRH